MDTNTRPQKIFPQLFLSPNAYILKWNSVFGLFVVDNNFFFRSRSEYKKISLMEEAKNSPWWTTRVCDILMRVELKRLYCFLLGLHMTCSKALVKLR